MPRPRATGCPLPWSGRPPEWTVSLGESNEQLQREFGISRERQDAFALRSHRLADAAWSAGNYDAITVGVPGVDLDRDEGIRPGTTAEKLAGLAPAFRPDGTITAGNASPLNDGASAVLIGSEAAERPPDLILRREQPGQRHRGRLDDFPSESLNDPGDDQHRGGYGQRRGQ